MWLFFILSTIGCMKKDMIQMARGAFTNQNCAKTLETYMRSAGCSDVQMVQRPMELIIRCQKKDEARGKMWDNYWFRITPSILKIHEEQIEEVERHTICKDQSHRIEAYPPE